MYSTKECKELMEEIDKIEDERIRKIFKKIVNDISDNYHESCKLEKKKVEKRVSEIMLSLGMNPRFDGYRYIKEAIIISVMDESMIQHITGNLYPYIANEFMTTPVRVERVIRYAIEDAWKNMSMATLSEIFGCTIDDNRKKLSNSRFIAMISAKIRLEFDK